jgi:hypothetical protein
LKVSFIYTFDYRSRYNGNARVASTTAVTTVSSRLLPSEELHKPIDTLYKKKVEVEEEMAAVERILDFVRARWVSLLVSLLVVGFVATTPFILTDDAKDQVRMSFGFGSSSDNNDARRDPSSNSMSLDEGVRLDQLDKEEVDDLGAAFAFPAEEDLQTEQPFREEADEEVDQLQLQQLDQEAPTLNSLEGGQEELEDIPLPEIDGRDNSAQAGKLRVEAAGDKTALVIRQAATRFSCGGDVKYLGGPIMPQPLITYLIYYGSIIGAQHKNTRMLIETFVRSMDNSPWWRINSEYYHEDENNRKQFVSNRIKLGGVVVSKSKFGNRLSDSAILYIVWNEINAFRTLPRADNAVYLVITGPEVVGTSSSIPSAKQLLLHSSIALPRY